MPDRRNASPTSAEVRHDRGDEMATETGSSASSGLLGSWKGLVEQAAIVGHHVWMERRLFEILGGWVTSTPEPDVKLFVAEQSRRHGWHAQIWFDRLPELRDLDPEEQVIPPTASLKTFMEQVAAADSGTTISRLVGIYRVVLPQLIVSYSRTLETASPVADASIVRWSRVVLTDDHEEWARGEALLRSLITSPAQLDAAMAHQARLERTLLDSGGY